MLNGTPVIDPVLAANLSPYRDQTTGDRIAPRLYSDTDGTILTNSNNYLVSPQDVPANIVSFVGRLDGSDVVPSGLALFAPKIGPFDPQYQDKWGAASEPGTTNFFVPAFTNIGNYQIGIRAAAAGEKIEKSELIFGAANRLEGGGDKSQTYFNSVHGLLAMRQGYLDASFGSPQMRIDPNVRIKGHYEDSRDYIESLKNGNPAEQRFAQDYQSFLDAQAARNINNWGDGVWGGDKDRSLAPQVQEWNSSDYPRNEMETANDVWTGFQRGGLGDTETAPTNFGALNDTLFDRGANYDNAANTPADFNGLEGYNGSTNYDFGNNETETLNDVYAQGGSDLYGYGTPDPNAYADYTPATTYAPYAGYDFADYGTADPSYEQSYYYYGEDSPVVLDLTGNGLRLTDLASSHMYYDMAGDGYQNRTAWASTGNAVLVLDTAGNGQITQRNQIVFTDWDPTAETDMQALANVFDTNRNGKLDAGDTQFASFKLLVTNADGTTSLQTLAQAGVASIDLIANSSVTMAITHALIRPQHDERGDRSSGLGRRD